MAHMDTFNADPFTLVNMTAAVNKFPRLPSLIGDLGLFSVKNITTEVASFEENSGRLSLIQTTPRGAPLVQAQRDVRKMRHLGAPRIAKADSLQAREIQGMRAFGTDSELATVVGEVSKRMAALNRDVQLTWENMRLGAVQGIVLDADNSALYNLYTLFGVTQPTEVNFDLNNASPASGALRKACAGIIRATKNACQNAWIQNRTYVAGICDDVFWDQLIAHPEVRETYKNWIAAAELRGDAHTGGFKFGGIEFLHYEGSDGSAETSSVKVPTGTCKFFPVNGDDDLWQNMFTPGESLEMVNTPGQPMYALTIPDRDRNTHVGLEVYSYPLFVCTRPLALQRARNT